MRFELKFPAVKIDEDTGTGLYHGPVIGKCFMCQERTSWIDLCFEGHLCSEGCEKAAYEDIARRTRHDAKDRYQISS
jgi:hypothetical protein